MLYVLFTSWASDITHILSFEKFSFEKAELKELVSREDWALSMKNEPALKKVNIILLTVPERGIGKDKKFYPCHRCS